jgi:hypothetical protein
MSRKRMSRRWWRKWWSRRQRHADEPPPLTEIRSSEDLSIFKASRGSGPCQLPGGENTIPSR